MYPNLNPTPSAPPYDPTNYPLPDEPKKPSGVIKTIFCLALAAFSWIAADITKYQNRELSNIFRVLSVGTLVVWFFSCISNSTPYVRRRRNDLPPSYHQDPPYIPPSIVVSPILTPYSGPLPSHNTPIYYQKNNPPNFSSSYQNPTQQSRNPSKNDSILVHPTNPYNSSSSYEYPNQHSVPQSRSSGHNDTIRYRST
jgi:hypothetical protein